MAERIDFQTEPARYRHWKLQFDGEVAELIMDVDENARPVRGLPAQAQLLRPGRRHRAGRRGAAAALRASRGEGRSSCRSGKDRVFCAGANIRMLAGSTHAHKVNFCKFTNETRNGMEDASASSGQKYLCAIRGTAAGGGYELALATDHILLADDGNSSVALPELPLLAVLPGTGGLTRVTDKRKVRRDLADAFCTVEEGVKGSPRRQVAARGPGGAQLQVRCRGEGGRRKLAAQSDRPGGDAKGIALTPLERKIEADAVTYSSVKVEIDRAHAARHHHDPGPERAAARLRRGHAAAGRAVLAAAAGARAGRRHPASAPQRGRDRRADLQVAGRPGAGAGLRCVPRRQQGPLAGARDPALLEARPEAHRPHLALAGGADRAGQLLCRHAGRDRLRLRPLVHADRQRSRATTARRRPSRCRRSTSAPIP